MKKRLTVIPSDRMICIDDICVTLDQNFPWLENNIHAIQWNEEKKIGHIEYTDGTPNKTINSITKYSSALDIFNSVMTSIDK